MSKNSKNARRTRDAKSWSNQRQNGGGGPKRTEKKNKKRNTWFAKLGGKVAPVATHPSEDGESEVVIS